jgi:hypothetical protein
MPDDISPKPPKSEDAATALSRTAALDIRQYTLLADSQVSKVSEAIGTLNRQMEEALRPLAEIHRHTTEMLRSFVPAIFQLQAPASLMPEFQKSIRDFIEGQSEVIRAFQTTYEVSGIREAIESIALFEREAAILKEAGFLPHATMPSDLMVGLSDPIQLAAAIEKHYQNNWDAVEAQLMARVDRYLVDNEAKAVFREALTNHRNGHFRSVVRLLFPEIERVSQTLIDFTTSSERKPHKVLLDLAGELSIDDVEPRGYRGFTLFERLADHIYVQVDRDRMESDPVPNRHAALHGLVIYRSFKNSLNTLFMTDYVFQIVSVITRPRTRNP